MPPLAGRRPGARRLAAVLAERGGDALAVGVRVLTGRRASAPTVSGPAPGAQPAAAQAARRAAAAEEAAARLDAARERLRATIAPPQDDEPPPST